MNIFTAIILWMIGKKLMMGTSYFIMVLIGLLWKVILEIIVDVCDNIR